MKKIQIRLRNCSDWEDYEIIYPGIEDIRLVNELECEHKQDCDAYICESCSQRVDAKFKSECKHKSYCNCKVESLCKKRGWHYFYTFLGVGETNCITCGKKLSEDKPEKIEKL